MFYHPDSLIKDHLGEGQEITIELINKVPVDGLGVPQMARWAYIAFNVSEGKQERRKEMIKEQLDEIEETRRRAEEDELKRRVELARRKILEMREVMRPQLQDEVSIKEIMADDWAHMSEGAQLDSICASFQEQSKIKKFFEMNYAAISDMFKHASAVGSDVGTDTISFMEFSAFLKESNAVHGVSHNVSERRGEESCKQAAKSDAPRPRVDLFFHAHPRKAANKRPRATPCDRVLTSFFFAHTLRRAFQNNFPLIDAPAQLQQFCWRTVLALFSGGSSALVRTAPLCAPLCGFAHLCAPRTC